MIKKGFKMKNYNCEYEYTKYKIVHDTDKKNRTSTVSLK